MRVVKWEARSFSAVASITLAHPRVSISLTILLQSFSIARRRRKSPHRHRPCQRLDRRAFRKRSHDSLSYAQARGDRPPARWKPGLIPQATSSRMVPTSPASAAQASVLPLPILSVRVRSTLEQELGSRDVAVRGRNDDRSRPRKWVKSPAVAQMMSRSLNVRIGGRVISAHP